MDARFVALCVCGWLALARASAQEAKGFDADSFKVEVTYMMPVSYPGKMLSYGYSVAVRHDSAFVHLPYMGRVYQPVVNDGGLHFALPVREARVRPVGDSGTRVEFRVRRTPVYYKFTVTAYDNGKADIMMIPSNAQSVTYSGDWDVE